jgi:hypothetical protein
MGMDARVSAFNRDSPDEPKFDAHGSDFRAFRKVPSVLVADRLQAGPKRHSIESETSGVVRPEKSNLKAAYKQDCHSLRSTTAQE